MTIVTINGNYFIPFASGFKRITKAEALHLYETGAVTREEDLTQEVAD